MSDIMITVVGNLSTGILTFAASTWYTSQQLQISSNVSLVPVSLEFIENSACEVDQSNLQAKISLIENTNDSIENTNDSNRFSSYEYYLQSLTANTTVLQRRIRFQDRLKDDNIITCNDIEIPDPIQIEIAALFAQPKNYLLKNSCILDYEGGKYPIQASTGPSDNTPNTILIKDTGSFIFSFEEEDIKEDFKESLPEYFNDFSIDSDQQLNLSVECPVIQTKHPPILGEGIVDVTVPETAQSANIAIRDDV